MSNERKLMLLFEHATGNGDIAFLSPKADFEAIVSRYGLEEGKSLSGLRAFAGFGVQILAYYLDDGWVRVRGNWAASQIATVIVRGEVWRSPISVTASNVDGFLDRMGVRESDMVHEEDRGTFHIHRVYRADWRWSSYESSDIVVMVSPAGLDQYGIPMHDISIKEVK